MTYQIKCWNAFKTILLSDLISSDCGCGVEAPSHDNESFWRRSLFEFSVKPSIKQTPGHHRQQSSTLYPPQIHLTSRWDAYDLLVHLPFKLLACEASAGFHGAADDPSVRLFSAPVGFTGPPEELLAPLFSGPVSGVYNAR